MAQNMSVVLSLLWGVGALVSLADGFTVPFSLATRPRVRNRQGRASMAAEEGYLSWLATKVDRARRPPFVKIARARLTRDFAVLLMRSSYQVRAHVCGFGLGSFEGHRNAHLRQSHARQD